MVVTCVSGRRVSIAAAESPTAVPISKMRLGRVAEIINNK